VNDHADDNSRAGDETMFRVVLSLRKRLFFCLMIVGVMLVVAEVVLRIAYPRLAWNAARYAWEGDEPFTSDGTEWPRSYPKGARGVHSYIEFDVPVSFNSDGFRDDEFDPDAGPVVIVLGDSTTAGHGVTKDETFVSLVESRLRKTYSKLQVWNLGRAGSGPVIQTRLLERILDRYPDARVECVVMVTAVSVRGYAGNDLLDMRRNIEFLKSGRPSPRNQPMRWRCLLRQLAIVHGVECLVAKWRRERIRSPRIEQWDKLWQDYDRCVERFVNLCHARNATPVVMQICSRATETVEDVRETVAKFRGCLDKRGIPLVTSVPAIAPGMRGRLFYYPIDGHENALGHAYAADRLAPVVESILAERRLAR
jgi:hypothetical protein